jgi:hypothetical protein
MGLILLIILVIVLLGVIPSWPYSRGWGYFPSGLITVLLIILIIMMFAGHIVFIR